MRSLRITATLLVLSTAPGLALAQFNYTSAEFSFVDVEYDAGIFDIDGDGFRIAGTYAIGESFFVSGEYEDYDFDFGVDGEVLEIGGGYHHTLNEDIDFVATFSYLDAEVSLGPASGDDDGLSLAGGVRGRLGDSIEVDAILKFVDMDAGDSETGIELRGRYYFSDEFAVTAGLDFGNDFETLSIGIRGEF